MEFYFSFGLLVFTLVTGLVWAVDYLIFSKKRAFAEGNGAELPALAAFSKSMFPVFLIVLVIRSFLVEPYRIPTPSMLPTLQVGDLIMVNKFAYGLKLPLWDYEWESVGVPKRGDVVVFHYPVDPDHYYIKRVIGIPGDVITYENKELMINGVSVSQKFNKRLVQSEEAMDRLLTEHEETMGDVRHDILRMPSEKSINFYQLKVPEGQYFMMGDNRDNSSDSRYWGFVPKNMIIGRPIMIFFSIDFDAKDIRWPRVGQLVS